MLILVLLNRTFAKSKFMQINSEITYTLPFGGFDFSALFTVSQGF